MTTRPWGKFFWADWEADEALRQCSLAAQGLWMRMLCIAAKGDPYGYVSIAGVPLDVAGLSTAVGRAETEVAPLFAELDRWRVFSRDRHGRVYSRRMIRDEKVANLGRKSVRRRWLQATEKQGKNPLPNGGANRDPNRDPNTQRPEARKNKYPDINKLNPASARTRARGNGQAEDLDLKNDPLCSLRSPAPSAPLKEKKKEQLRQKLMRFCNATMPEAECKAAIMGLMGEDPDHSAQWWLDTLDLAMRARKWNDVRP